MGIFERFLTLWVGLCIVAGVALGNLIPGTFELIAGIEYAHVNLVVAVLIWIMIYPMMVQVDFSAIRDVGKKPKGLVLTLVVNWLIKPFKSPFAMTFRSRVMLICRCFPSSVFFLPFYK